MTPEQQRIAIARACGWTTIYQASSSRHTPKPSDPWIGNLLSENKAGHLIPDYLNDLNAMHEAEKGLFDRNDWSACKYQETLQQQVMPTPSWTWHATAAQRAEAFLRTIGKWTDD